LTHNEETLLKDKSNDRHKKPSNSRARWLISIFLMALTISAAFSFLSQGLLNGASLFGAFVVLFAIIAIGIFFDLLGVSVTAAEEKPFHSMASRKVPGGTEGIWLLRNAGKVSSVCCDVVGDICGIISGTAAAVIALEAASAMRGPSLTVIQLLLSALVAALTILGKAFCKQLALDNSTAIVQAAAKVIWRFKRLFSRKKKR
jgi:CBS domain containing-hemolysin-like protein